MRRETELRIGGGLWTGITVSFLLVMSILHSSKANALGQTEEGILYGIGIYKIWDIINEEEEWRAGETYGNSDSFPPFKCRGDAIDCSYQKGVYDREKEEWYDKKQKAYECGRYGRNCETSTLLPETP